MHAHMQAELTQRSGGNNNSHNMLFLNKIY